MVDILPDSRLKQSRLVVSGEHPYAEGSINWVKIFCANCGTPYGYVPEQNCDFACWLCDPCSEKWGEQFGLALMPDEVFWRRVQEEMIAKYGRILTDAELREEAHFSCNSLAKLLREGKLAARNATVKIIIASSALSAAGASMANFVRQEK